MKRNIKKGYEHRGNYEEVLKNYEEEMKMIGKNPKAFYSPDGGVRKFNDD